MIERAPCLWGLSCEAPSALVLISFYGLRKVTVLNSSADKNRSTFIPGSESALLFGELRVRGDGTLRGTLSWAVWPLVARTTPVAAPRPGWGGCALSLRTVQAPD